MSIIPVRLEDKLRVLPVEVYPPRGPHWAFESLEGSEVFTTSKAFRLRNRTMPVQQRGSVQPVKPSPAEIAFFQAVVPRGVWRVGYTQHAGRR